MMYRLRIIHISAPHQAMHTSGELDSPVIIHLGEDSSEVQQICAHPPPFPSLLRSVPPSLLAINVICG